MHTVVIIWSESHESADRGLAFSTFIHRIYVNRMNSNNSTSDTTSTIGLQIEISPVWDCGQLLHIGFTMLQWLPYQ